MKRNLTLSLALLASLWLSGCATGDRISQQNAHEAKDTIDKYLDPALPDSAKSAAKLQAQKWVEYEDAKFGK
jgi:outer membrane murein-binding lipoprotein Lpp